MVVTVIENPLLKNLYFSHNKIHQRPLDQSPQSPNVLSVLTTLSPLDLAAKVHLLESFCSCELHSSRNEDLFRAAKDSNDSQDSVCLVSNFRKWYFF